MFRFWQKIEKHGLSMISGGLLLPMLITITTPLSATEHNRQLLWGDTHLHTSYSFDAYLFQNRSADPDTAYRYARGLPVIHPYHRARIQIETPLDFLVVADHAENLAASLTVMISALIKRVVGAAMLCSVSAASLPQPVRSAAMANSRPP